VKLHCAANLEAVDAPLDEALDVSLGLRDIVVGVEARVTAARGGAHVRVQAALETPRVDVVTDSCEQREHRM
jgi:hypothetical protein